MAAVIPSIVYLLCLITSTACAFLLGRAWRKARNALLGWSALCFVLLALNNLFVMMDLIVVPQIDFGSARLAFSLSAVLVLLFGFVWNSGGQT